jgi:F0F1-type ATP synthase membrane subunit c/vacuolar-type H+-ATPase subunit K
MAGPGTSPAMQTLRLLVGAVVGAIFLMAVAFSFVLGFAAPALWTVLVLLLLGAVVYAVLDRTGYRVAAIYPQLPADQARAQAITAFQGSLIRRLVLAESVAIVAIVLAFVAGRSVLVFDVGAAVSVLLLAVHVWPSIRTVDRVVAGLERDGAHTGLREMLGFGGPADGPVTRLD